MEHTRERRKKKHRTLFRTVRQLIFGGLDEFRRRKKGVKRTGVTKKGEFRYRGEKCASTKVPERVAEISAAPTCSGGSKEVNVLASRKRANSGIGERRAQLPRYLNWLPTTTKYVQREEEEEEDVEVEEQEDEEEEDEMEEEKDQKKKREKRKRRRKRRGQKVKGGRKEENNAYSKKWGTLPGSLVQFVLCFLKPNCG